MQLLFDQVPPVKHDIQRDPNSCLQSHPLYLPVMNTSDEEELFGLPSSLSVVLINTLGLGEWSGGSQTPPSAYSDIRADYTPVNTLPAPKPSRNKSHHLSCAFESVTPLLQIHRFLLMCSDVTFSYCLSSDKLHLTGFGRLVFISVEFSSHWSKM